MDISSKSQNELETEVQAPLLATRAMPQVHGGRVHFLGRQPRIPVVQK